MRVRTLGDVTLSSALSLKRLSFGLKIGIDFFVARDTTRARCAAWIVGRDAADARCGRNDDDEDAWWTAAIVGWLSAEEVPGSEL